MLLLAVSGGSYWHTLIFELGRQYCYICFRMVCYESYHIIIVDYMLCIFRGVSKKGTGSLLHHYLPY